MDGDLVQVFPTQLGSSPDFFFSSFFPSLHTHGGSLHRHECISNLSFAICLENHQRVQLFPWQGSHSGEHWAKSRRKAEKRVVWSPRWKNLSVDQTCEARTNPRAVISFPLYHSYHPLQRSHPIINLLFTTIRVSDVLIIRMKTPHCVLVFQSTRVHRVATPPFASSNLPSTEKFDLCSTVSYKTDANHTSE